MAQRPTAVVSGYLLHPEYAENVNRGSMRGVKANLPGDDAHRSSGTSGRSSRINLSDVAVTSAWRNLIRRFARADLSSGAAERRTAQLQPGLGMQTAWGAPHARCVEPSASAGDLLTGGSINGRGDRRDPLARYHGRSTGIGWCGLCHRLDCQRNSRARRHCWRLASRHLAALKTLSIADPCGVYAYVGGSGKSGLVVLLASYSE